MNPLSRWLLVVATFGLLTLSTPAAVADDETPVLWSGAIQAGSARPLPADVTAYLQPTADTTVSEEGVRLTPISSTTAGPDGRFTLRASYDDRIRAAEDRAGWISVLVVAMTADGMSMDVQQVPDGLRRPDGLCAQADDVDRRHAHRTGWHHGLQDAVQDRGARRFYLAREDGSSQSFSGALSILGFSGGATSVNSNAVRHAWFNRDTRTRHLCGVSDFPSKSSRVVSLPI